VTPPVQQHALENRIGTLGSAAEREQTRRVHAHLSPRDVVFLTDVWILLSVLWASRLFTGNLDPAIALFGLAAFVLVVSPKQHRERLSVGSLDDSGHVFARVWVAYGVSSAVAIVTGVGELQTLLAVSIAMAPALVAGRAISHTVGRKMKTGEAKTRTLIVGAGDVARRAVATIDQHQEYGLHVVGAADDDPMFERTDLGTPTIGRLDEIPELVRTHEVDVVLVAFSAASQQSMISVIRDAMSAGATVWVVPRFFELGAAGDSGDHLWGLPVMRLQAPARSRREWVLKRALDFSLSAIGIALLSPVLGFIALLVAIESGRPILHRQTRVGIDGRPFEILKFRSMRPAGAVEKTEWSADEQRMTRIGRFLRDTSLDELPQLFNVIKGEMSLVGPRPERPYFVHLFSELYPSYGTRHRLPAGVTGWAQVHGLRGDTSIEERAAFDNYYIENWSVAQDMKILLRTIGAVLTRR
jgi:exopolysaccharide biosynthesis polyprenyl glycosylphosphotransferase